MSEIVKMLERDGVVEKWEAMKILRNQTPTGHQNSCGLV
jgi:SUMO ligase MMS21 Smc5/6 complex component